MFNDNSLEKPLKKKQIQSRAIKKLQSELNKVSSSLSIHKNMNSRVDIFSQQLSSYFNSVTDIRIEEIIMNEAAVVIQKAIRGYLVRAKLAAVIQK